MELKAIVPSSPKLPVKPIIIAAQEEPGILPAWFLTAHRYTTQDSCSPIWMNE
jgi:hypothetical protein